MNFNVISSFRNTSAAIICLGFIGTLHGMTDPMESFETAPDQAEFHAPAPMMLPTRDMLASLPASVFDYTADGITADEMGILFEAGESQNWKVMGSVSGRLIIQSNHAPDSKVSVHAFAKGQDSVLVIETQERLQTIVETWFYDARHEVVTRQELLPKVLIHDFYAAEDHDAGLHRFNSNVFMWVDEDGTIGYAVSTWMEDGLADKRKAFEYSAFWDGTAFRLVRTALNRG